jgi:hypothetical protein
MTLFALMLAAGIGFWDTPRRGANLFNEVESRERLRAAREAGIGWVRLVPDKWKSERRDFLIGDADDFRGLVPQDLARLEEVLGWAEEERMPVVLGMLGLPGCRWGQKNGGKDDYRLWHDERYQEQAVAFWKELAVRLRGRTGIVAYDPLNEPHPEREAKLEPEDAGFSAWLKSARGGPADLDRFYARIVGAIREGDPDRPILVEGYGYGGVAGLTVLKPLADPAILYSFHFYDPWQFTTFRANKGRYAYPGGMPDAWDGPPRPWDRSALDRKLEPVGQWADRHGIPAKRIVAAEFGCDRLVPGARDYLADLVKALRGRGWHWAFYSFREDAWPRMDYEMTTSGRRGPNPLWKVIQEGLASSPE